MVKIRRITDNKRDFMELLLLADEQEEMVLKYLDRGEMYVLYEDGKLCGECVVTDEGNSVCELKNIAVYPEHQGKGFGKMLIKYVEKKFSRNFSVMKAGTGDSPLTIPFYESCGFVKSGRIKNFFIQNYDHPIFEAGVQLIDMIYLEKNLKNGGKNA